MAARLPSPPRWCAALTWALFLSADTASVRQPGAECRVSHCRRVSSVCELRGNALGASGHGQDVLRLTDVCESTPPQPLRKSRATVGDGSVRLAAPKGSRAVNGAARAEAVHNAHLDSAEPVAPSARRSPQHLCHRCRGSASCSWLAWKRECPEGSQCCAPTPARRTQPRQSCSFPAAPGDRERANKPN